MQNLIQEKHVRLAGLWKEKEYLHAVCTSAELNTKQTGVVNKI